MSLEIFYEGHWKVHDITTQIQICRKDHSFEISACSTVQPNVPTVRCSKSMIEEQMEKAKPNVNGLKIS